MTGINIIEKQLALEDKDKVESIRKKYNYNTSSHTFASLYIWRKTMGEILCIGDDFYTVKCESKGKNAWFFPCGEEQKQKSFVEKSIKNKDFYLCYMRDEDKKFLEENFKNKFLITEIESDNEYIYDREAFEKLEGRKYAALRNHIRRAERDNELAVELISKNKINDVINIIKDWEKLKTEDGSIENTDEIPSIKLIKNFDALSVYGIIVKVNEEPFAVVAGFPISEDTFDMCLAKQKSNLSGLSVFAKHQFVVNLDKKYKFINAEEDLGIDGLRIMKKQMQPIGQIKMYDGRLLSDD
ncbi:MAG: DUF2156 domain-containing protein [Lachnospiraceae bacterium]|nr:DUF2156 domain-containing protein [Lachnospiraceae bacterium]